MEFFANLLKDLGLEGVAVIVLALSIFIDFSPIKLNPIKFVMKTLGDAFNSSIDKKLDAVKQELSTEINASKQERIAQIEEVRKEIAAISHTQDDLKKEQTRQMTKINDNEIRRLRFEILNFSNTITMGQTHTIDEYEHIMEVYGDYHKLIDENNLTNGRIDAEFQIIQEHYKVGRESGKRMF